MRDIWAILEDAMPIISKIEDGVALTGLEVMALRGTASQSSSTHGAVAVIPIRGVISHRGDDFFGGTSTERLAQMVRAVAADDSINTIVYDIDSPGGTVTGLQELAAEMFALRGRKRQIAVANSMIASAAYHLASQADEIVAIPSSMSVGSIGVFAGHVDQSGAMEQDGIKVTLFKAGKYKTEGNPYEPLGDEARAHIQGKVDAAYRQFVADVARGRGVTPAAVRDGFGEGRALAAKEAKAAGLVDRIATLDDVLGRATGRRASAGLRAEDDMYPDEVALNEPPMAIEEDDPDEALRDRFERL